MKKLVLLMAVMFSMAFVSCTGNADKKVVGNDSITNDSTVVDSVNYVENAIAMDKENMNLTYGKDYKWFETCVVLNEYLDSENTNDSVVGISNIFQVLEEKSSKSFDVHVIMYTHVGDSTQVDVKHGFWVEDKPMNNDSIKVTFKEAYAKLMATNLPKPHSRQCVLRKEIGPKECNPQYIFGNSEAQIYVDAVTGNVTDMNPAFPTKLNYSFNW